MKALLCGFLGSAIVAGVTSLFNIGRPWDLAIAFSCGVVALGVQRIDR